jgi:hypothetical protein
MKFLNNYRKNKIAPNSSLKNGCTFPGAVILYPLLALVCLFFYFVFWGRGIDSTLHVGWISWWCIAVLVYIFGSLYALAKSICSKRLLVVGGLLIFFAFFVLQTTIFHIAADKDKLVIVYILVVCVTAILMDTIYKRILWCLPFMVIIVYYVADNLIFTIFATMISLIILASVDIRTTSKSTKVLLTIGISVFYLTTTYVYFPLNPLLLSLDIKEYCISRQPNQVSLIVNENGKYSIIDGSSFYGERPLDAKFDCYEQIAQYPWTFVGFRNKQFKKYESVVLKQIQQIKLYPIIVSDSCSYFTSSMGVYNLINHETKDSCIRLTAEVYKDFIEIYNNPKTNRTKIASHQAELQANYISLTTNSVKIRNDSTINQEKILKDLSQNMALGMLNALCSDLIYNNDINSALRIFAFQFYLTYFDAPIYHNINTTINYNFKIDSCTVVSGKIIDKELHQKDTFEPWTKVVTMSTAMARSYAMERRSCLLHSLKQSVAKRTESSDLTDLLQAYLDRQSIFDTNPYTKNISQFAITLQEFLYQYILHDDMPDYSSFFLNRFNDLSQIEPFHDQSISMYDEISKFYQKKFDDSRKEIDSLYTSIQTQNNAAREFLELLNDAKPHSK